MGRTAPAAHPQPAPQAGASQPGAWAGGTPYFDERTGEYVTQPGIPGAVPKSTPPTTRPNTGVIDTNPVPGTTQTQGMVGVPGDENSRPVAKPLPPQAQALATKVQSLMADGRITTEEFDSIRADMHALFGSMDARLAGGNALRHNKGQPLSPIARTVPAYNYRQENAVAALRADRARNGIVEGLPPDPNVFPQKDNSTTMGGFTNPLRAIAGGGAITDPMFIK